MIKSFFDFLSNLFLGKKIVFSFDERDSPLLGKIRKPIAEVKLFDSKKKMWQSITMIVDTGADYTILPRYQAEYIGIDLKKDTREIETEGVGGKAKIYLAKNRIKVKIGERERSIVLGIIDSNRIPPLMGFYSFLETFKVVLEKFTTTFS